MDNFNGNGFDKSPIDGDEAAKVRHMAHEVDEVWPYIRDTVAVQRSFKIMQSALKIGLSIGVPVFAVFAYAASKGWIG